MKKSLCLLMIVVIILILAACSDSNSSSPSAAPYAADAVSSTEAAEATETIETAAEEPAGSDDGVDVDLTSMSSTMVYSEVLNMQQDPESYIGKTVKMKGPFNVTEINGNRYFACVIADATDCCSTGIEFVRKGDYSYPEDYPKEKEEITVVGTFNTYMEGKNKYLQLKDTELQF